MLNVIQEQIKWADAMVDRIDTQLQYIAKNDDYFAEKDELENDKQMLLGIAMSLMILERQEKNGTLPSHEPLKKEEEAQPWPN